jgi:hypothetical protein
VASRSRSCCTPSVGKEICDANAYTSLLRAWRQAAKLIEDNPTEYDDYML